MDDGDDLVDAHGLTEVARGKTEAVAERGLDLFEDLCRDRRGVDLDRRLQ